MPTRCIGIKPGTDTHASKNLRLRTRSRSARVAAEVAVVAGAVAGAGIGRPPAFAVADSAAGAAVGGALPKGTVCSDAVAETFGVGAKPGVGPVVAETRAGPGPFDMEIAA